MNTDARGAPVLTPVASGSIVAPRSTNSSLANSLNAQIEDLVQRNRSFEHTIHKLREEKDRDVERARREIQDMRKEWTAERTSWREGTNRLLSNHHLAHLRLSAKLSTSESAVLKEMEVIRQEKVARLHRDFQITMFGVRETELEMKIEDLEEDLVEARRGKETRDDEVGEQIQELDEQITALVEERSALETELLELRENNSRLQVKSQSSETKLERLTLQYQGLQSEKTDLQRLNDELKLTNTDLKRQMDRWQNLETKGGEEVETLRKRRLELEVQVKSLDERLDKKDAELKKVKEKMAALKEDYEQRVQAQEEEAQQARTEISKAHKLIERLRCDIDAQKKKTPQRKPDSPSISEDEVANDFAEDPTPSSPPAKASKIRSKKSQPVAGPSTLSDDPDIEEIPNPKGRTRTRTKAEAAEGGPKKAKTKAKRAAQQSDDDDGESEDESRATKGSREKGKGKSRAVEEIVDSEEEEEEEEEEEVKTAARAKRKRAEEGGRSRKPLNEAAEPRPTKTTAAKSRKAATARGGSVQPRGTAIVEDDGSGGEEEPVAKKKKRAIGLFPSSSQPASFNFLPAGEGGGLDIPSVLSPVKDSDVVPSRAAPISRTASMMGSIGGLFGARRR
ncbi:hypothetical protein FB45DRAFT_887458 [Roridomyces roridus]|uniref:Uncharacterized protein n=1 Tax=Roridomyces roridus TaxID=1738132 RepID=A0AAD7CJ77_9AGAR|nr:hypothetical protein FB45DRAFT_887458 [Roridomyces roridus]